MPAAELSEEGLLAWGEAFGRALAPGACVTLEGELGAGKTTLVQAITRGLGVTEEVTSPTYALVHDYASPRGRVLHLDLYRLRDASQLVQLGWDTIVGSGSTLLIEWPERAGQELPAHRHRLSLAHVVGRPEVRRLEWTD